MWFRCGWFEPSEKEMEHVEMSLSGIVLPPSMPWRLKLTTVNLARSHLHLHYAELSKTERTKKKLKSVNHKRIDP